MSEYIMDEICKGCLSYERTGTKIPHSSSIYNMCRGYVVKDINCPCQYCLIKSMCDRVCEAFTKTLWYDGTLNEEIEYRMKRNYNKEEWETFYNSKIVF